MVNRLVYGRIAWGVYDQIFTLPAGASQEFEYPDDEQTTVEVANFDPEKYETVHPVKMVCIATARFQLAGELEAAFTRLTNDELPVGQPKRNRCKGEIVP
jgi:hypothetical protein